MTYLTYFVATDDTAKAESFDQREQGHFSVYGTHISIGDLRIDLHQMSAQQAEQLAVAMHKAAIELGLKCAEEPASDDDVFELVPTPPHVTPDMDAHDAHK